MDLLAFGRTRARALCFLLPVGKLLVSKRSSGTGYCETAGGFARPAFVSYFEAVSEDFRSNF